MAEKFLTRIILVPTQKTARLISGVGGSVCRVILKMIDQMPESEAL